jgi:hypothetical protein
MRWRAEHAASETRRDPIWGSGVPPTQASRSHEQVSQQRHLAKRKLGLWLSMAALAIQMLLPLLIAVEIRLLTQDPFLFGGLDPTLTCTHDSDGQPASPKRHDMAACPLCMALAVTHATTLAASSILPLPRQSVVVAEAAPATTPSVPCHHASYDARGPPART